MFHITHLYLNHFPVEVGMRSNSVLYKHSIHSKHLYLLCKWLFSSKSTLRYIMLPPNTKHIKKIISCSCFLQVVAILSHSLLIGTYPAYVLPVCFVKNNKIKALKTGPEYQHHIQWSFLSFI